MTPIEKNKTTKTIDVTDEFGNVYYKTYYKRAQGLIKKGRARLVSENRICLTCPPDSHVSNHINNNSEDIDMMDQSREIVVFAQEKINQLYEKYQGAAPGEFDDDVIEAVVSVTKHLLDTAVKLEALNKLADIATSNGLDGDNIRHIYDTIFDS